MERCVCEIQAKEVNMRHSICRVIERTIWTLVSLRASIVRATIGSLLREHPPNSVAQEIFKWNHRDADC
jgi:hypothetical protein